MKSVLAAGVLAAMAFAVPASAAQILNDAGDRGVTVSSYQPLGQSFTAIDSSLLSIGFQFLSLNPTQANTPMTLTLRSGDGATGAIVATRTVTLPGTINDRNPVWFDFDFTGTGLTIGSSYTALLTNSSSRLAVQYGPRSTNTAQPLGPDAYLGGKLVSVGDPDPYGFCTRSGMCDLNFRVTGTTAAAAVPEPATWAMMLAGFLALGFAMRGSRKHVARVRFA